MFLFATAVIFAIVFICGFDLCPLHFIAAFSCLVRSALSSHFVFTLSTLSLRRQTFLSYRCWLHSSRCICPWPIVLFREKAMACIHCRKHVGRRYCDECFLWWAAHTTQWQLWSVVQSRRTETLAARVCQDKSMGKLVCSFFVPTSSFVVHTGSRDVSLSTSARRLGKLYGLKVVPCVLQRLVIYFGDDPEYLHNKGFSIVACGTRSHMITLAELFK